MLTCLGVLHISHAELHPSIYYSACSAVCVVQWIVPGVLLGSLCGMRTQRGSPPCMATYGAVRGACMAAFVSPGSLAGGIGEVLSGRFYSFI